MSAGTWDIEDDEKPTPKIAYAAPSSSASAARTRFAASLRESAQRDQSAAQGDMRDAFGAAPARRAASPSAEASSKGSIARLVAFVVIAVIAARLILMDAYYTVAGWAFVGIVPPTWDESTVRVGGSLIVINAWMATQALFLAVQTGFFPVALSRGKFVIVGDRLSIAAWVVLTLLNALSTIVGLYVDLPSWSSFGAMAASNVALHAAFSVAAGVFVSVASERIFIASLASIRSEAALLRSRRWRK